MKADESGYVPPDHKTTAEFRVPPKPPAGGAVEGEATVVDRPLPDDRDDMEQTASDHPAPATVTDLPMDDLPADDLPAGDEHGVVAAAARPGPWTEQFGNEEAGRDEEDRRRHAPTAPHPGLAAAPATPGLVEPGDPTPAGGLPGGAGAPMEPESPVPVGGVPAGMHQGAVPPPGGFAPEAGPVPPPGGPAPDQPTPAGGVLPGAASPFPPPPGPVHSGLPPAAPTSGRRSRLPLVLAAAVFAVVLIGGAAAYILASGGADDPKRSTPNRPVTAGGPTGPGGSALPAPGTSPSGVPPAGGGPAPTGGPQAGATPGPGAPPASPPPTTPIGPVVKGNGLTYALVQQDPGYYEGLLVITNRSDKPMKNWTLTFEAKDVNVKNVWGGKLVRGGGKVEIRNLDGAAPIPPGATFEIRFGAEGAPATPDRCRFNDKSCGLE